MSVKQILHDLPESPQPIAEVNWPTQSRISVIAPHPDDFDAIAVTLKYFQDQQYPIQLFVLSGGSKGVQDTFLGSDDWELKAATREAEQLASTDLFELPRDQIMFLRMQEAEDGELADSPENFQKLATVLSAQQSDIWCLPHGNDTNTGHQRTYTMVQRHAATLDSPVVGLFNKDAKTLAFQAQLFMPFEQDTADWKASLLRCHVSQQARNLNLRGHGFDDRVLSFNQQCAEELGLAQPYAELFQVEILGG